MLDSGRLPGMGLMDRDYWREKHATKPQRQRPGLDPRLKHLQAGMDALQSQPSTVHSRPHPARRVAPQPGTRLGRWIVPAVVFLALCVGTVAVLSLIAHLR